MWVDNFRAWARAAPMATGPLKNGDARDALGCSKTVVLIFDDNGRVFEVLPPWKISDGCFVQIRQPRAEIAKMMHVFGTVEFPTFPDVKEEE